MSQLTRSGDLTIIELPGGSLKQSGISAYNARPATRQIDFWKSNILYPEKAMYEKR
jgi:hypothetical protein